jgi:hypothetical protein
MSQKLQIQETLKTVPPLRRQPLLIAAILLTLVKLWVTGSQTLWAIDYPHDDSLYVNLAGSLAAQNWLGNYNELTLAKGPFYPAWIAGAYTLGIPLLLSQQILYIVACLVCVLALRPVLLSPLALFLTYSFLLFSPMSYASGVANRVAREGIYSSLSLLVCAGAIGLLLRHHRPFQSLLPWSVVLGIAATCFWLTREEGVWLIPLILLCLGWFLFQTWREKPAKVIPGLALCLIPYFIYMGCAEWIKEKNAKAYQAPLVVELKSKEFLSAYGALTRVKHENWNPMIPLPLDARKKIYQVSPAFRELEPHIEGRIGRRWASIFSPSGTPGEEIVGGFLLWTLRESARVAGYYTSWPHAKKFYARVASEINAACEEGTLVCFSERSSLAPLWHKEYFFPLIGGFLHSIYALAVLEDFTPLSNPSMDEGAVFDRFKKMTGEDLGENRDRWVIQGWAFGLQAPIQIAIVNNKGEEIPATIHWSNRQDVYEHYFYKEGIEYPNAIQSGFYIKDFKGENLSIAVKEGRQTLGVLPLDGAQNHLNTDAFRLYIDSIRHLTWKTELKKWVEGLQVKFLKFLGRLYQFLIPLLLLVSSATLIVLLVKDIRARKPSLIAVILLALLFSVFFRSILLALIDISSFPALSIIYLSPAYSLLLILCALSIITLIRATPRNRSIA